MSNFMEKLFWWPKLILEVTCVILCLIPVLIFKLILLVFPKRCKDVSGQVALITGTAQGLGREMALELARLGCSVICVDVLTKENEKTAQDVIKLGQKSSAHTCDISNRDAVQELANKVNNVDILINNAAIIHFDPFSKIPHHTMKKVIDVNVTGHFWMLEAFLPKMLERGKGHVVGIASCGGLEVLPDASLYCATKFAVVGLMKTLAEEFRLRSENIKFTCVCPYFVKTFKEVESRVESRIPALEAKETAISIVKGIRQELSIFTVPSSFYGMFLFQSILPKKIQELMRGVIYARVSSREDEHNSTTDKKVP